jgi:hypothetical protein
MDKTTIVIKVHLQFLKRILGVRVTTPNCLVYGELGRYPLDINIKCRMLCFWSRLITPILYELVNKNLFHMCFNPDYINRNLVSKDKTKANIIQNSLYIFYI